MHSWEESLTDPLWGDGEAALLALKLTKNKTILWDVH